jgi:outer membrane protein
LSEIFFEVRKMRNAGIFLIGLAWGMAFLPPAWGAETLKIGYVDMQRALNQCQAGREAKKLITSEVEKVQKTFGAKEKERDYQARLRDLQRMQRDFEEDLRRKDREFTDRVLRDLAMIVRKLGEERGYTLILERNQAAIVYVSGGLDLTDEVIKMADQKGK